MTPIALVVRGLLPGHRYRTTVSTEDGAAVLGVATADAAGTARLPVFRLREAGDHHIALRPLAGGPTRYIHVSQRRSPV